MTNVASPTPYLALSGGTVTGNVTVNGHLQFGGTAPNAAAGGNAGGSPPAPVVDTGANDAAGHITFGTGTLPAAGTLAQVTFNTPWVIPGGGAPHITVTPLNAATEALGLYISGSSPTGFGIAAVNAPAASQANTTYSVAYVVMG